MISSMFTTHLCINEKNGCGEDLHVKKLEDHEKYCIFQNVQCPVITCTKSIVFKDAQKHLDETHKCLKVDDEWEFKGTQEEMIQNVCCLSSSQPCNSSNDTFAAPRCFTQIWKQAHKLLLNPFWGVCFTGKRKG